MYLPTELHDEILQHLGKADLPAYRLICRDFASHGARPLFQRIRFKTSLPEFKRLARISTRPHLGSCVKLLVWDTNYCGYEAESLCEGLKTRELDWLLKGTSASQACTSQTDEQTLDDGKQPSIGSLGLFLFQAIFSGLPNLCKLYVLAADFPAQEYPQWRTGHSSEVEASNQDWYATREGYEKLSSSRSKRIVKSDGSYEVQIALLAARLAGCSMLELRGGYLNWRPFLQAYIWPPMEPFAHLTSLRLVLSLPSAQLAHRVLPGEISHTPSRGAMISLRNALHSATGLHALELQLDPQIWWQATDFQRPGLVLQDIVASTQQFPFLKELTLHR
ncbi:hypothetical protein BU26DRAFT_506072 [Trematosphaeria pertusa]|uniref:F-box domain-containing protein n=1 Tax=Trematosphaeria pertusa TaxID=390896 RepID=A0A6A6ID84_9PLEO|nr:uncharacterized protein BU26DRAFT_506072 [Trematosphaeria pertusa]KAF2248351.1 hypothetical protein BU26DRAFT_506072 [Trematosphaeria pertusa]